MAEKLRKSCLWCLEHRINVILGMLILSIAGMMPMIFLTYEKEPQIVSAPVIVVNDGYDDMEKNPLHECRNEEINQAVRKYYTRLAENADYVEAYEDMEIYEKKGMYEGTYVVFVKYNMKISGLYTSVPGLGTLYVEKTENGKMKVDSRVADEETKEVIALVTGHEDVKSLFQEVETAYVQAVQSDAMLAEALNDLQSAAKGK